MSHSEASPSSSVAPLDRRDVLAAMQTSGRAFIAMVRSLEPDEGACPVPRLPGWTVADTAAHVCTVFGRVLGDRRRSANAAGLADLNQACLDEYPMSDLPAIADELESRLRRVVTDVYPRVPDGRRPFHGGTTIGVTEGATIPLGEFLVHGDDIATALDARWEVDRQAAYLVARGVTSVLPAWLRTDLAVPSERILVGVADVDQTLTFDLAGDDPSVTWSHGMADGLTATSTIHEVLFGFLFRRVAVRSSVLQDLSGHFTTL